MDHYQFAKPDGHLDWTPGRIDFAALWELTKDHLRFHKGEGFALRVRPGAFAPAVRLAEVPDPLKAALDGEARDTIVDVRSLLDAFTLSFRRHKVPDDKGRIVVAEAASRKDTPYEFRVTDCSWLSMECVSNVSGISLPHNAHLQRLAPIVVPIPRSKVKPGDLVFIHDDDHVAIWLDDQGGGRVWDTEPHDAPAPSGWPTPKLSTGVQIRPAFGNYYCAEINAFGRIVAVNGAP